MYRALRSDDHGGFSKLHIWLDPVAGADAVDALFVPVYIFNMLFELTKDDKDQDRIGKGSAYEGVLRDFKNIISLLPYNSIIRQNLFGVGTEFISMFGGKNKDESLSMRQYNKNMVINSINNPYNYTAQSFLQTPHKSVIAWALYNMGLAHKPGDNFIDNMGEVKTVKPKKK